MLAVKLLKNARAGDYPARSDTSEHVEITGVWIAPESFLDLQSQPIHTSPHVCSPTASHTRTPDGTAIIGAPKLRQAWTALRYQR